MRWLAFVVLAGCLHSASVTCDDGRLCPAGQVCDQIDQLCVVPDQLTTCVGLADGTACKFDAGTQSGECHGMVCLAPACGNGIVTSGEVCDGNIPEVGTCVDYNYDYGPLTCSALCSDGFDSCRRLGWRFEALGGVGQIHAIAEDAGVTWLANQTGLYRHDAMGWALVPDIGAQSVRYRAIWAGNGHVFAVGSAGGTTAWVAHYDGATWTQSLLATGTIISPEIPYGVWARDPTDVFVVGERGHIFHYDGTTWSPMVSKTTSVLNAVWGDGGYVVAVGAAGTIDEFDGTGWSLASAITAVDLFGVSGSSATDVFVMGAGGQYLHRVGIDKWDAIDFNMATPIFRAVSIRSATEGYAVGDGGGTSNIFRWDGFGWAAMVSPTDADLLAVNAGATAVYAASNSDTLLVYAGKGWVDSAPNTFTPMFGMWGAGLDYVAAVGDSCAVEEYDGTRWSQAVAVACGCSTNNLLLDVWGTSSTNVFASGPHGVMGHRSASSWGCDAMPNNNWVYGVWGSGPGDVYGVGQDAVGAMPDLVHYNGAIWVDQTAQLPAGVVTLRGIWGSGAQDIFAVGSGGTIVHFNGTSWTKMTVPVVVDLAAVWGTTATNVYAVGAAGTILHYDGTSWTVMAIPRGLTLAIDVGFAHIHGTAADDIYVVGQHALLHFDGVSWSPVSHVDASAVNAVWATPGNVFIAGDRGVGRRLVGPL